MLSKIIGKIADALYKGGLITQNDLEIYRFGIEAALIKLIHYSTIILIGILFGMVIETVIFIIAYSALREYAGGYHATNSIRCYCISILMITSVLLTTKLCSVQIMFWISISTMIPLYFIIFVLAPVQNINRPLDEIEILKYRKIARIVLTAEEIVLSTFMFLNIQDSFIINLSLAYTAILLILGKIKYNREICHLDD
jgi:Membrane protein putatively involved in post-translational modification of the autoinducing quorum-sensing peptide